MSLKVNPFESLPSYLVKKIAHDTGELTNATRVSQQFRFEANAEAQDILRSLLAQHNPHLLDVAILSLNAPSNSNHASAVDVLFKEAKKFCSELKLNILTKADPYHPWLISDYLHAFLKAQDMDTFFRAVMEQAPPTLKEAMSQAKFVDHPLTKYEQMKSFFQQHAHELSSMTFLVIRYSSVRTLPEEIGLFANLKSMNLSNNQISSLPPTLFLLKELNTLNLSHNSLLELPKEIGTLKNLEYLFLDSNKIRRLPSQISQLVNLKCLHVNNNLLSHLPPSIGYLSALTFLSASGNQITELPNSINDLILLKALHLSGNKISALPLDLNKLQSLEVFSLIDNELNRFPLQIMSLSNLKILMLSQNRLFYLPSTLNEMPSLEELDAGANYLLLSYEFPKLKHYRAEANMGVHKTQSNFQVSQLTFSHIYNALGDQKWKEFVEGTLHLHGPYVFDQGLHSGNVEPGFAASMESAYEFLRNNFDRELDADFYLNLHQHTCSHFDGPATQTLIGQDNVGFFRGSAVHLNAPFNAASGYKMSQKAIDEFNELNRWITHRFGPSFALGSIKKTSNSPVEHRIIYHLMSQEQVRILFTFFVSEFHFELSRANDKRPVLVAIAKLIQRLEWLHPVADGCGRTDTALLNYLLAKYGYTPVLLDYPYRSSCRGLKKWVKELEQGMSMWKIEADTQFYLKLQADQSRQDQAVMDFWET